MKFRKLLRTRKKNSKSIHFNNLNMIVGKKKDLK